MEQTEKKRDFKVLAEKISPENILIMSELLAIKETKTLIRFMSRHAVIAHAKLCKDVFCKDTRGYVLSDCYDIVQSVAVFSANISENIWTISCISRNEGKGSR